MNKGKKYFNFFLTMVKIFYGNYEFKLTRRSLDFHT